MKTSKLFTTLCVFATLAVVSGCGGGGGNNADNGNNGDISQIPDDFDLMEQPGTWRMSAVTHTNLNNDITLGDVTVNVQGTINSSQLLVKSWNPNGSEIIESSCWVAAPENVMDNSFADDHLDGGYDDLGFSDCVSETMDYIRVTDSHYRIEYSCDNFFSYTLEFIKLYDQTEFNFGNLSFTSLLHEDLNATAGVCGTLTELRDVSAFTPQPNNFGLEDHDKNPKSFSVMGPYIGNRISIDFKFFSDIQVGSYTVVDVPESNDEVHVVLSSVTFGGTPDDPGFSHAESGVVNVTSIGTYSVTGTFEILTRDGDSMSGSFSFNIE